MNAPSWSYAVGGTLAADAPSYVERRADRDLLDSLKAGDTCYVLNSRQMGKSSLCVRTIKKLREAGFRTVFLDLTKFGGKNLTAEQWYAALLAETGRELGLRSEFLAHWKQNSDLPPVQRLFGAITEIALQDKYPVAVFVDEIDVTLSLPFSADEFFAAIRQCHVARATDERLSRLTFCLLGTATPADLIQDTRVSPFNVGRRIELRDFTAEEAMPLAAGLQTPALLQRVLYWTGGHPYLTQRLCKAVGDNGSGDVDQVCRDLFLAHSAREGDDNLAFVRNRLLRSDVDLFALLELYRLVRSGKRVKDEDSNPLCGLLKLSGVCRSEGGSLVERCRIYRTVFDDKWITANLPDAEVRRQKRAYRRGFVRSAMLAAVVLAVMAWLSVSALNSASEARIQTAIARDSEKRSLSSRALAEERGRAAAEAAALAQRESLKATSERANALLQKQRADKKSLESQRLAAQRERALALERRSTARAEREAARARVANAKTATERERAERFLYLANMRLAQSEWETNNLARVKALLRETAKSPYKSFEWSFWMSKCHPKSLLASFHDHTDGVNSVALSPDGSLVASASDDGRVVVRSVPLRRILTSYSGHSEAVRSVAFSPDGSKVITTSSDDTAQIWDPRTGNELLSLAGFVEDVNSGSFSADGRFVVTASDDSTIRVWSAKTGEEIKLFEMPGRSVACAAFSPDGKKVAAGSQDGILQTWDLDSSKPEVKLQEDGGSIRSISYSPDGRTIALGTWSSVGKIIDASTGKRTLTLQGHYGAVLSTQYSVDGKSILTAGSDSSVKIWDSVSGELSRTLVGSGAAVTSAALSSNGRFVAAGSLDHSTRIWDLAKSDEAPQLKGHSNLVSILAFSPKSDQLASGAFDGTVRTWKVDAGSSTTISIQSSMAGSVAFLPTRDELAICSSDIKVVNPSSGVIARSYPTPAGGLGKIWSGPSGSILTGARGASEAVLWDMAKNEVVKSFPTDLSDTTCMAQSQDGKLVAVGQKSGQVTIYETVSAKKIRTLQGLTKLVLELTFSPDAKLIGSTSSDGAAKIWKVRTGEALLSFLGTPSLNPSFAFLPDGKRVVYTSILDGTTLWDTQTGKQVLSLRGNSFGDVVSAVSPDGRHIAVGRFDSVIRLYSTSPPEDFTKWLDADREEEIAASRARKESEAREAKAAKEAEEAELRKREAEEKVRRLGIRVLKETRWNSKWNFDKSSPDSNWVLAKGVWSLSKGGMRSADGPDSQCYAYVPVAETGDFDIWAEFEASNDMHMGAWSDDEQSLSNYTGFIALLGGYGNVNGVIRGGLTSRLSPEGNLVRVNARIQRGRHSMQFSRRHGYLWLFYDNALTAFAKDPNPKKTVHRVGFLGGWRGKQVIYRVRVSPSAISRSSAANRILNRISAASEPDPKLVLGQFYSLLKLDARRAETTAEALAARIFRESALNLNNMAWALVDPQAGAPGTDYNLALKLARQAVAAPGGDTPNYQDTLAMCLYLTGDLEQALSIQRAAVARAKEPGSKVSPASIKELESHLRLYEAKARSGAR